MSSTNEVWNQLEDVMVQARNAAQSRSLAEVVQNRQTDSWNKPVIGQFLGALEEIMASAEDKMKVPSDDPWDESWNDFHYCLLVYDHGKNWLEVELRKFLD